MEVLLCLSQQLYYVLNLQEYYTENVTSSLVSLSRADAVRHQEEEAEEYSSSADKEGKFNH